MNILAIINNHIPTAPTALAIHMFNYYAKKQENSTRH